VPKIAVVGDMSRGSNYILVLYDFALLVKKRVLPWALVLADIRQILRRTAMELIK